MAKAFSEVNVEIGLGKTKSAHTVEQEADMQKLSGQENSVSLTDENVVVVRLTAIDEGLT